MADAVTPNDMPKAETPTDKSVVTEAKTDTPTDTPSGVASDERAELERLRAIHKDESKWEKRSKQNFDDAEKYRQLMAQLGGDADKGFDPQAAIADLNSKFESERTARIRADVARTEGVDPDDFTGSTEDEMRASAQRYKAKLQTQIDAAVEQALKGRAPAAAPAGEVTANGKVQGPNQITSRDELKNMSPKEILAAKEEGRLDGLLGK